MDIVTHALMGIVAASPFLDRHPVAAAAFVFGCVAPDLDSLSRVFGRTAFLRAHQTWSHSALGMATSGAIAGLACAALGVDGVAAGTGFALGMAFHTLLDWTNTYGLTPFAPFSRRRVCLEWVFFIDAFALLSTIVAVVALGARFASGAAIGSDIALTWAGVSLAYWLAKGALRRRALPVCPGERLSLIPSALVPWTFLGCSRVDGDLVTYTVNALTRRRRDEVRHAALHGPDADVVRALAPFRAMRGLSAAYVVSERIDVDDAVHVVCRDLRTRNFATRFGRLDVVLDRDLRVTHVEFHV